MSDLDFSEAGVRKLNITSRRGNRFEIDITADMSLKFAELGQKHVDAKGRDFAIVRELFDLLGLPIDEFELGDMDRILEKFFADLEEDKKPGVKKKRPAGGKGSATSSGSTAARLKNGRPSRKRSGKSSRGK